MPLVHSDVTQCVEPHSRHQNTDQKIYHTWIKMLSEVRIWFTVTLHEFKWVFKYLN